MGLTSRATRGPAFFGNLPEEELVGRAACLLLPRTLHALVGNLVHLDILIGQQLSQLSERREAKAFAATTTAA